MPYIERVVQGLFGQDLKKVGLSIVNPPPPIDLLFGFISDLYHVFTALEKITFNLEHPSFS